MFCLFQQIVENNGLENSISGRDHSGPGTPDLGDLKIFLYRLQKVRFIFGNLYSAL